MKNRAQQLMDHSEDWVDGSWTVDCVCGVNFDDGEEMVDCDECGVWVHTRCSRYVKGEKSFACDKCKLKNNRNISEETEVAQLLVDLPKNTMRMEDSYRLNDASSRRPLRLWTEKPMEDRVHVHGIPGGDPQLFAGLSGIFTPQLWKATGYVPKKFNFCYKEFPCWEQDEEKISKDQHENPSPVDTGANVLYSMSKETLFGTRLRIPLGTRVSGKGENFDTKVDAKETKSLGLFNPDADLSHDDSENEKRIRRSGLFKSTQQMNDLITSQNRTGKRKSRATDKDIDGKKRVRHSSVGYSTASNSKIHESSRNKDAKLYRNDFQGALKYSELNDVPRDLVLKSNLPHEDTFVKAKKYSKCDNVLEASPGGTANCNSSIEAMQKVEKVGDQSTEVIEGYVVISSSLINNVETFSLKEEVVGSVSCFGTDQSDISADVMRSEADIKLPPCMTCPAVPEVQDSQISQDSTVDTSNQIQQPKLEVDSTSSNIKMTGDALKHLINKSLASPDPLNCKVNGTSVSDEVCIDKERMVQANSNAANFRANASDEFTDTCIAPKLESAEGCKTLKRSSIENNHGSVQAENYLETGEATPTRSSTLLPSQRKMVVSVARSLSTNSVFKSVASDDSRAEESRKSSISVRKRAGTTRNIHVVKERGVSFADKDGERHRKNPKEGPGASENSDWKSSHFSKLSCSHASKESFSRSKDRESQSFAKAKQDNIVTSDSGESAGSQQARGVALGQCNVASSGSSGSLQKGRKHSQITNNTSAKTINMAPTSRHLLSASHAALSDEELALLLHQELNSSPRVPRIPRMRQAGSLPQSASPTAANTLSKRTSGFGVNEYTSVSRRKYKDPSGDGTRLADELDVRSRKGDKSFSSQNQCVKESTPKVDSFIKRELEERSSKTYGAAKRKGPSSVNVTKSHSSSRSSLKNVFEELEEGGSATYRTLPGLISEIMSKGKRMTYEELCSAVLPHWHDLRKHNGERYAYSSHSQAVLDCLRNRSEWAQLVDRGPKTNPGRKRRKLDAEPATSESEDAILEKNKTLRVPKQHDFPKGKRKARKGRRLALQGREVKDLRKSHSVETASEDDDEEDGSLYSNSMEQSSSSGDDAEESGSGGPGSEVSVSSDES